jgi:choline transport protein
MDCKTPVEPKCEPEAERANSPTANIPINPSHHRQELERNFGFLSICSLAITTGESWVVLGNSIVCVYITLATRRLTTL